jgi:hypothetical protein
MALPRPTLLAIAGVVLSLMSFMSMRTIGATSAGEPPLPAPPAQSAAPPADSRPGTRPKKPKAPPPPKLQGVPPAVADALAGGKVVVLLFVQRGGAEDRATARHLSALSSLGSRVRAFRVDIGKVGRYAGIVANLGISQAPAVVIVGPDLKATAPIEGYVESGYLRQRVKDQLR